MSNSTTSTWAQMAARGADIRCYQPTKRRSNEAAASQYPLVGSILYEDDDFKGQILASKAMAIVQQALTSGSVLFSFRKGLFGDRVDAYKTIQQQVSPLVEFRPLSVYDDRNDGSLLIEAKFEEVEAASKALNTGVTVNGVVYKAVLAKETREFGELKHVQFTLMRIVREPTFLVDLMDSLAYYGKVLQVKQFTRGGFFEGKFSVMLDTSVGHQVGEEWQAANPLDRMLYLSEFDCFVAATYKGAPPVCHFCRHSGHIRAKCPELAKRRCFKCGKQGHMLRFCPDKEGDEQAGYLKKKKVSHQVEVSEEVTKARDATSKMMDIIDKERMGKEKEEKEDENLESDSDESASLLGDDSDDGSVDASENDKSTAGDSLKDTMQDLQRKDHQDKYNTDEDMQDEEIILAGAANKSTAVRSSAYSKYAPNTVGMSMQVDKREEMLGMTSLRQETQRKRQAFDVKLKQGSVGGFGSSKGVKTGSMAGGQGSGVSGVSGGGKTDNTQSTGESVRPF
ncbi:hypothetical protein G6F42_011703 [Rhizopus arrhizus]|nr:hypothetical protein G6F42_011703 [Rhizopus arrhizus]